jgi:hypothetical protein
MPQALANEPMIRNRGLRRAVSGAFLATGALLMWFAPETPAGVVALVLGVALEALGIHLEHRNRK